MKNITTLLGSLLILCGVYTSKVAAEGFTIGANGILGAVEASGTEHERTDKGDSQKTAHDAGAIFIGADIFAEYEWSNGLAIGYSMVPADADIGSGKRTDTVQIADDNDTGDRSASAELTDLTTIYATKTLGGSNSYILLGYHQATVTTAETLPNSTYGDADIDGFQVGIGTKVPVGNGAIRYEISYSDFDDITLNSSTGATGQKITADVDAIQAKLGFNF